MTARLQALKSELEKRSLVLDEEGLKVCGQLMEVFPSYVMESVSAVVAMHAKDFVGNSEGLMSACVDFFLDEDNPYLKVFLHETSQNNDPGSMTPDDKLCRDKVWRSVELLQSGNTSDTCSSSISSRSGSPNLLCPEEEKSQNAASLVPFPSASEATSRSKEDNNLADSLNKAEVIFSTASSHGVAHHCEEDSNADSSVDLLLSSVTNDCSTALPETRPYTLAGDNASSSSSAAASHPLKDVEQESAGRKSAWRTVSPPSPSLDSDSSDTLLDHYESNEDSPSSFPRVVNSAVNIIQPKIVNLTSNSATAETSATKQQDSISSLSSFAPHSDMGLQVSDVGLHVSDPEHSTESSLSGTHQIGGSSRQLPVVSAVANASFCNEEDTDRLKVHPASSLKSLKPASFRIPSAFVRETSISSSKVTDNDDEEQVLPSIVAPRQRCSSQKLKLAKNPTAGLSQAPCAIHPSLSQSNASDTAGISHSEAEGITYLGKSSPQVPNQSVSQRSLLDHPPSISLVAPSEQQQSKTVSNMHPNSGSKVCIGNLSVAPAGLLQSKTVLTPSPSNSHLASLLGVSNMPPNASSEVTISNVSVAPAGLLLSKTIQTPSPSNSRLVSLLGASNMHLNASSKVSVGSLSVAPAELLQSKTVQTSSPSKSRLVSLLGVSKMHPSAGLEVSVGNPPVPRPTATETSGPKDNRSDAVRKLDDIAVKYLGNGNHMGVLKTTAQCISTCSLQEPKTFKTDSSVASTHPVPSLLSYPPVPANTVFNKLDFPFSSSYSVNSSLPRVSPSLNPSSTQAPVPANTVLKKLDSSCSSSYSVNSSLPRVSPALNPLPAYSTAYTQQLPRLVYPHSHQTCDLGVKPPITSCHPSGQNNRNRDLAGSHWTNSTHTSSYQLLAGSSGVTSVQLTAVTPGVTAGRQDPVPSTSGYKKRLNAETPHTMASVNSQIADGKSDASKRKESSDIDRWGYRDYPQSPDPLVIDDSLNDSQGSVQFLENSPQRAMNNPADLHKTEQLPEHQGLDFGVQSVLEVFPDIEITYVRDMLKHCLAAGVVWYHAINNVLNQLLENPNFPTCLDSSHSVHLTKTSKKDYFNDYSDPVISPSSAIATTTWDLLSWDFRLIGRNEIKQVMSRYNYHYAPVYRCLSKAMASITEAKSSSPDFKSRVITVVCHEGKDNEWKAVFKLLKKPRMRGKQMKEFVQHLPPALVAETEFVQHYLKQEKEESDRQIAWQLLEKEYDEEGQAIECGCCYTQYPFEKLVQCFDGHLFCCDCLQGYAREAIFGSGKLNLMCMTEGCETTFPKSQLIKALPDDVMQKYDECLAEESLNMAEISDLVRCPYCNLAAVLDANVQIFKCPGPNCQKTTCRNCKEDWEDHLGKSCQEVEKKDETKLRREYEEKMTSLRVRTCPSCKAQFFKEEGCNKMTCRCGATMCYLCRTPSITYKHFCQHPRDPGHGCTKCSACSLWTNPDEDETKAIAEVQREAQVQRKEHGYLDNKVIGVPDAPPAKKRKA